MQFKNNLKPIEDLAQICGPDSAPIVCKDVVVHVAKMGTDPNTSVQAIHWGITVLPDTQYPPPPLLRKSALYRRT